MNRKSIIIVFAVVIIVLAAISISAANVQNNVQIKKNNSSGIYCNFTDGNNDGICDNCNNTNPKCDGTKQHIRNQTHLNLTDKKNQYFNKDISNLQNGNQHNGNDRSSNENSNSQAGSGYQYGHSSSSKVDTTKSNSGYHHGQSSNGQHSQQRLQIRDC